MEYPQVRKKQLANNKQKHKNIVYNQKTIRQRERLIEKVKKKDKDIK